jgi:hypothetical protein
MRRPQAAHGSATAPSRAWRGVLANLIGFLFQYRATIDDNILVVDIELDDADPNLLADQLFQLFAVANATAGRRQESARADIHGEAAFDRASDAARYNFLVFESTGKPVPVARSRPGHS